MTVLLMALVLLLSAACATALASEAKTLTVGAGAEYATIQAAIDYVAAQDDPTGWTISVQAGTYDRFTVPHYNASKIDSLTIAGADRDSVIVNVLNGALTDDALVDNGGINIYGSNVTLKNMTIQAGTAKAAWDDAAISTHHGKSGGKNVSLTVENCKLIGPGIGSGATYGIFWACDRVEVKNCHIEGFANAVEFMNDNFNVPAGETFEITGNTIAGASFAVHGYFGGGNGGGTLLIANNAITGTDALRSKVIVQDNTTNSLVVDIKNNTLENTVVGIVNLQDEGDTISDILSSNAFGKNCFYVEAIEPGTIQFYSTYYSPSGQYGLWKLTGIDDFEVDWGKNPDGSTAFIQAVVDEANASNSHVLSITGIDEENLIKTFTWFKDGIYWETLPEPEPAEVILKAAKTLDGKSPTDSAFRFVLKDADGKPVQVKANNGGDIVFDALSFSDEGVYTYTIEEVTGENRFIRYDETVYTVTITVTLVDNNYAAAVAITKNGEAYTGIPGFANIRLQVNVPQTGDDTPLFAAMLALVLSAGLFVWMRRRRHA